jgi:hypothetical protein
MSLSSDLTAHFNSARGFATAATYDGATAVSVHFETEYIDSNGMGGHGPAAWGRTSDFPVAAIGKTLLISGTTYRITHRRLQDDGKVVVLMLEEQ